VRDAVAAWNSGTPAVLLVHEPFARIALTQCQRLGAPAPMVTVYKQDAPAFESEADWDEKARKVAGEVMDTLRGGGTGSARTGVDGEG
jgi:hypothetical protein